MTASRMPRPPGASGTSPCGQVAGVDHHRLAGKRRCDARHDLFGVLHRAVDADRVVLPIGQDVDDHQVDRARHLGILQPEFPDVGIGDDGLGLGAHAADQLGELVGRHLAAQQHLVADDERLDRVGIAVGEGDGAADLHGVVRRVAADPGAEDDLEPEPLGDRHGHVEALVGRVDAHAIDFGAERLEIGLDALGRHEEVGIERRLAALKRRIGDALELAAGDVDQGHRPAGEPPAQKRDSRRHDKGGEAKPAGSGRQGGDGHGRGRIMHERRGPVRDFSARSAMLICGRRDRGRGICCS